MHVEGATLINRKQEDVLMQEVSATAKLKDEEGKLTGEESTSTVEYDFGENLEDAVAKFGDEVVFSAFKRSAVIDLQSNMRRWILNGDDCQEKADEWQPGVKTITRKSPVEKLRDLLKGKSPEEIATLLQQVQEGGFEDEDQENAA